MGGDWLLSSQALWRAQQWPPAAVQQSRRLQQQAAVHQKPEAPHRRPPLNAAAPAIPNTRVFGPAKINCADARLCSSRCHAVVAQHATSAGPRSRDPNSGYVGRCIRNAIAAKAVRLQHPAHKRPVPAHISVNIKPAAAVARLRNGLVSTINGRINKLAMRRCCRRLQPGVAVAQVPPQHAMPNRTTRPGHRRCHESRWLRRWLRLHRQL